MEVDAARLMRSESRGHFAREEGGVVFLRKRASQRRRRGQTPIRTLGGEPPPAGRRVMDDRAAPGRPALNCDVSVCPRRPWR